MLTQQQLRLLTDLEGFTQTDSFEINLCGWMGTTFSFSFSANYTTHQSQQQAFCNRSWADGTAMSHDGSNTMNYSIVWMSPKKRAGVLIATNISYDGLNLDLDKVVAFMIRKHI